MAKTSKLLNFVKKYSFPLLVQSMGLSSIKPETSFPNWTLKSDKGWDEFLKRHGKSAEYVLIGEDLHNIWMAEISAEFVPK